MARLDDSFLYDDEPKDDRLDDSFLYDEPKPEKSTFDSVVDTVSGIGETAQRYAKGIYEGVPAAFENRREIAGKINASLGSAQIGAASALGQIGKNENDFYGYDGPDLLTDALNDYVEGNKKKATKRLDTAIKNLEQAEKKQKLTPSGEFVRQAGTSTLETAGAMLAGGSMKSVMSGIAAMGPQVFGQNYEQLKKEGEGEGGAVKHAIGKTVIELGSEIPAFSKLLNMPDGIVRKIADMTAVEGGTEAASSIADSLYDASVRDKNLDWDAEFDKAVESFKLGAASGAMIGSVAAAPQAAGIIGESAVDIGKSAVDKSKQFAKSVKGDGGLVITDPSVDQAGQPSELFNPTHKAGGGNDVQVATKNGRIIPDTYIDEQGNTIRDANAVANDPDQGIDVTQDVSAVAASIKNEIFNKYADKKVSENSPDLKADQVIESLEQQNQSTINKEFAAPSPEVGNQKVMNEINFGPTADQLRQKEIDTIFANEPVMGQQGTAPEIPVTKAEINQKKIEGYSAQGLTDGITVQPKQEPRLLPRKKADSQIELQDTKLEKKLKPLRKLADITKMDKAKPSDILRYATDKPRLSAKEMAGLTKSIQEKGITRPAILLKDSKGKVTLEDGHHLTRIAENLGIDVPIKVIEQKKGESDIQVASRVLEAAGNIDNTTLADDVDIAAKQAATSPENNLPEPTEAQKEAGNYKKGNVNVQGFDIAIENPAGSKRRPEWPTLKQHYGYIKRTVGADSKPGAKGNKIEQISLLTSGELSKSWQFVGRLTQDLVNRRNIESYAGLQYESCCWAIRFAYHRSINSQVYVQQTSDDFQNKFDSGFVIQFVIKGLGGQQSSVGIEDMFNSSIFGYKRPYFLNN